MYDCPDLSGSLPDVPRWLEPRAWMLCGDCDVFGYSHVGKMMSGYVVRSTRAPLAAVIGRPSVEALLRAVDIIGSQTELLVAPEDAEHVRHVLRFWIERPATLHQRTSDDMPRIHHDPSVRIFDPWVPRGQRKWPAELKHAVRASLVVAARRVNGEVVAACHTDAITETLWDVAVDTAAAHRRQGHARACFVALDQYMHARGKRPVWGALDENHASLAFAASLGFRAIDKLIVFTSPRHRN